MTTKSFTFDLGNRDLTTEELGVVKKARQSFADSAARHGVHIAADDVLIRARSSGTDVVPPPAQSRVKVGTARDNAPQTPPLGTGVCKA